MESSQVYANELELAYFGWDETLSSNNIREFSPNEKTSSAKTSSDLKSIIDKLFLKIILFSISIFLLIEELEWITFSQTQGKEEECTDKTDWNIDNTLNKLYRIN
tara:strand:- start:251 stop:565 length:315 start_codon:yes stop_codon:yes gene_type:complete